jgi:hypothetical protein
MTDRLTDQRLDEIAARADRRAQQTGHRPVAAEQLAGGRRYWIAVDIPAKCVDEGLADALGHAASRVETVLQDEHGYEASAWHAIPEHPADAVLAVLPAPTDTAAEEADVDTVANRAAQVISSMGAEIRELRRQRDRYRTAWHSARRRASVLSAEITRRAPLLGEYAVQIANLRTMYDVAYARTNDLIEERDRLLEDRATVRAALRDAADAVFALDYDEMVSEQDDENLGSMREAWDLGTIHATELLRRLADETQDTQPATACAHCGAPIRLITGTLAAWWVHDPDGNTICHPEHAAASTRATPTTAVRPDGPADTPTDPR